MNGNEATSRVCVCVVSRSRCTVTQHVTHIYTHTKRLGLGTGERTRSPSITECLVDANQSVCASVCKRVCACKSRSVLRNICAHFWGVSACVHVQCAPDQMQQIHTHIIFIHIYPFGRAQSPLPQSHSHINTHSQSQPAQQQKTKQRQRQQQQLNIRR